MSELERLQETISCLREELQSMKERVIQAVSSGSYFFERPPTVLEARAWVGLTDDEFKQVCWESGGDGITGDREESLRAMEALLKEKNGG